MGKPFLWLYVQLFVILAYAGIQYYCRRERVRR